MRNKTTYEDLLLRIQELEQEKAHWLEVKRSLLQSQEELAEIFALSPDLICIADINSATFLRVNPAFIRALGYSESELLGRSFLEFIHPDDVEATIRVLNEELQYGHKVNNFTNRYRCADGSFRWLEWISHPVKERGITFAAARDITDRRMTEKALHQSESFIRAVMDNLPIGIAVNSVDPTVSFEYMNENFPLLYRTTREALSATDSFWEAVYESPELREVMRNRVLADCSTGDPERMHWDDVPLPRKGQKTHYVCARNVPVPEKGLMISTVWDVTPHKETEEALRETKRLLDETQALTHLGGWEYDIMENRLTWTDEVYRIHGLDPASGAINSEEAMSYYLDEHKELMEKAFYRAITTGESYDLELQLHRADGRRIWVRTVGKAIYQDGKVVRVSGNILDISERKCAEQERERLQAQIFQIQKMESIGRLAGGVAHDFNNMLGGIIGAAELLALRTDERNRELVNVILQSAERAADLTSKLLAFGRKGRMATAPVNVHQAIRHAVAILERSLDKRIELVITEGAKQACIIGDDTMLQNVFINMGVNAGHSMPEGGHLIFRTGCETLTEADCNASSFSLTPGDFIAVYVEDEGCGIPPENLEHIFEPFFTTRGVSEGTGLGLAAVYGTVVDHKGGITVSSQIGKGTVFRILLPLAKSFETSEKTTGSLIKGSGTVLLVDDEALIRNTVRLMLEELNYQVILAEDGPTAIKLFKMNRETIDIVILDMIMPKMGGQETFEALLAIDPGVRVILSSGYAQGNALKDIQRTGLKFFLRKPCRIRELSHVLNEVFHSPT